MLQDSPIRSLVSKLKVKRTVAKLAGHGRNIKLSKAAIRILRRQVEKNA